MATASPGRGPSLNETIHVLRPLTENLIPVMHNLAAPKTGFGELWRALDRPAEETAPVADANARFFVYLDTFFSAWASVAHSLELAIEGGPPSLEQAIYSFKHQQRFYENSTEFMRLLRPTAVALRQAAPPFAEAVSAGIPNLLAAAQLNRRLESFLGKLREFSRDPVVTVALEEFTKTVQLGNTVLAGLAPAQATCNYVTLTFRNLASLLAEDIGVGTLARVKAVLGAFGTQQRVGTGLGARRGTLARPRRSPGGNPAYNDNFLHYNPYPNVTAPGQPRALRSGRTRCTPPASVVIGHAAKATNNREPTKREENLFGEKYPASTLKELGISTGKGRSEHERPRTAMAPRQANARTGSWRYIRRRDEVPVAELQRPARPAAQGDRVLVDARDRRLLRVHEAHPVHARLPPARRLPDRGQHLAEIRRAHRGRQRRQGDRDKARRRIRRSDDGNLQLRGCRSTRTRRSRSARGSSSKATGSSNCSPGSPGSPTLSSGSTLPVTQASDPVQLDQVLDALNTDTRANLQEFLIQFGKAYSEKPTPAENAEQEPEVQGLTGAEAINRAARRGPKALKGAAIVNQAIGGTHERDLSTLIDSIRRVTGALDVHSQALGELITNFNIFLSEFANQSANLSATVARLPGALTNATRAFVALEAALPPLRAFSEAIIPGVEETPATVSAFLPWIKQVRASLAPSELGGLARNLRESAPSIAQLTSDSVPFYQQNDLLSQCLTNVLIPAGNAQLQDGPNSSGEGAFNEFWYSMVGANSLGQNFTGNGISAFRSLVGAGGSTLFSAAPTVIGQKTTSSYGLVSRATLAPLGTRPAFPSSEPPYKPMSSCYKQAVPNFNGPLSSGPAD